MYTTILSSLQHVRGLQALCCLNLKVKMEVTGAKNVSVCPVGNVETFLKRGGKRLLYFLAKFLRIG